MLAHTNGRGDFVLFDSLGAPWPIHECYEARFCERVNKNLVSGLRLIIERPTFNITIRESRVDEYRAIERHVPSKERAVDIERIEPEYFIGQQRTINGIVREVIKNRVPTLQKNLGTVGSEIVAKAIGLRDAQITIVDVDLASITAFADLRNSGIAKGDLVQATLSVLKIDPLQPPYRFICERVLRPRLFA